MDAKVGLKPEVKVIKEPIPHLLVPGEMGAVLELTVKDKDGKVTEHRVMRSKSYVKQFLQLLYVQMNACGTTGAVSIRDIANALQDIWATKDNFKCDADAGEVNEGIIVGTGTTAPTIDDYKIETIIDHGTDPGELEYSAVVIAAATSDATTSQVTITRDFANGSGGEIIVNEIALYVWAWSDTPPENIMTIRDVIGGGIAVPDGQTLTVNYREQAVV
ncbi:hypothetical protein ES703_64362 [subsurface metagenome]